MANNVVLDCQVEVFNHLGPKVLAGFSLKDPMHPNGFSTRLTDPRSPDTISEIAEKLGTMPSQLVLTQRWPHGNRVIIVGSHTELKQNRALGTRFPGLPVDTYGYADSCDGFVTTRSDLVLTVQGADCPTLFVYDPTIGAIGIAHCGWKPLVRGIVFSVIDQMIRLGSKPENIQAYLGPGAGDNVYEFDDDAPTHAIFKAAEREWLLKPHIRFYRRFEPDAKATLASVLGRSSDSLGDHVFALTDLALSDLSYLGVRAVNADRRSTILDPSLHSHRRDGADSGRSLSFIGLQTDR
ncbi:polyphenol oxidase family protein [Candidatus Saccharibacteria bacterium]|nr:polyphenol oxidase family protein [Candidatus Saccharibacteria bacterium]